MHNLRMVVNCSPRSAKLTERGCKLRQQVAEEALSLVMDVRLKGGGGCTLGLNRTQLDCLAACSVCENWDCADKKYFAQALKDDVTELIQKFDGMDWNRGDPEIAMVRRKESQRRFENTEKRKAYLKQWRENKKKMKAGMGVPCLQE